MTSVWAFGPHGSGPNILLGAEAGAAPWLNDPEEEGQTRTLGRASAAQSLGLSVPERGALPCPTATVACAGATDDSAPCGQRRAACIQRVPTSCGLV